MGVGFMAIRDGALIGGLPFVFVFAWVWGFSLAASALFVLPLFALAPRLRVPPLWLTTVWGGLVAFVWMRLLAGLMGFRISPAAAGRNWSSRAARPARRTRS
jgi:hypothetical protein